MKWITWGLGNEPALPVKITHTIIIKPCLYWAVMSSLYPPSYTTVITGRAFSLSLCPSIIIFALTFLFLSYIRQLLQLIFPLFKKKATFLTVFETLHKEKEKQKGTQQLIYQDIKNWMRPPKTAAAKMLQNPESKTSGPSPSLIYSLYLWGKGR